MSIRENVLHVTSSVGATLDERQALEAEGLNPGDDGVLMAYRLGHADGYETARFNFDTDA